MSDTLVVELVNRIAANEALTQRIASENERVRGLLPAFTEATGIPPSTVGRLALNASSLAHELAQGNAVSPQRLTKLYRWMLDQIMQQRTKQHYGVEP